MTVMQRRGAPLLSWGLLYNKLRFETNPPVGTNFGGLYVLEGNYIMKNQVNVPTPKICTYRWLRLETSLVIQQTPEEVSVSRNFDFLENGIKPFLVVVYSRSPLLRICLQFRLERGD